MRQDRRGITALADAMIFIVIMSMAFSALYLYEDDDVDVGNSASDITDAVFYSKMKLKDIMDTDDSKIVSITDLIAASMVTDNKSVFNYLEELMETVNGRPDSYRLTMTYGEKERCLGSGDGIPISGCTSEFTVKYGGTLIISLDVF